MPTKPRPSAKPTPKPRRRAKATPKTCPVLAGFARLKELEQVSGTEVDADTVVTPPDRPPLVIIDDPVTPSPPASTRPWLRLLLIFALGVTLGTLVEFPSRNLGRQTIRRYARECDAQACQALLKANDGTMTGEDAAKIIERVAPAIKHVTWKDAADRFTALQDADGKISKPAGDALILELSRGFRSIH